MFSKGQLEIQFNWIFVLVVGAIVMGFFLIIINNQQEQASVEQATELVQRLDTVFTTLSKHPNTVDEFNIPKVNIEFVCEEGLSEYYIQGTGPVPTSFDIIFTPANLLGNKIITWTTLWEIPFEVGVFTYMANDRTLFVFINETDAGLATFSLFKQMPPEFAKLNLASITDLDVSGYDRVVLISDQSDLASIINSVDPTIAKEIVFRGFEANDPADIDFGTIMFASAKSPARQTTKPFLLVESLYGSFFSEDAQTYECTMNKAYTRLKILSTILSKRSSALQNELSSSVCYTSQVASNDLFTQMRQLDFNEADVGTLYYLGFDQRLGLERLASDSLRGYTCPFVY